MDGFESLGINNFNRIENFNLDNELQTLEKDMIQEQEFRDIEKYLSDCEVEYSKFEGIYN